jgi:hypothetical protein
MVLQHSAKTVLWLFSSAILALIVAIVLAAISVSGVTSVRAALTLLWITLVIFCLAMLATGILYCPTQPGGRSALIALALVGFVGAGWWGRSALAQWLVEQKATQEAAAKVPKPPDPKPPLGHILPSAGKQAVPGIGITQGGHNNTANPVTIDHSNIHLEPCSLAQIGGSNNTGNVDCGPPQRSLTPDQRGSLRQHFCKMPTYNYDLFKSVFPATDNDSAQYADQITKIMYSCHRGPGMNVGTFFMPAEFPYGISVHYLDTAANGSSAFTFALALKLALEQGRVSTTLVQDEKLKPGEIDLVVGGARKP